MIEIILYLCQISEIRAFSRSVWSLQAAASFTAIFIRLILCNIGCSKFYPHHTCKIVVHIPCSVHNILSTQWAHNTYKSNIIIQKPRASCHTWPIYRSVKEIFTNMRSACIERWLCSASRWQCAGYNFLCSRRRTHRTCASPYHCGHRCEFYRHLKIHKASQLHVARAIPITSFGLF